MSVNVGQRNVPDTPANKAFAAGEKAMEVALHTIKICKNKNIFTAEYQEALTNDIIRCAKDIYIFTWSGNNIYVSEKQKEGWPERERLQIAAYRKCNELLSLQNIARRLFHLRGKKVRYWAQLTVDARKLIKEWHRSNADQYGKQVSSERASSLSESRQRE